MLTAYYNCFLVALVFVCFKTPVSLPTELYSCFNFPQSLYGPTVSRSLSPLQLVIKNNADEARQLLLQNPQLAYALLQAQVIMRLIDPKMAQEMLHRGGPQRAESAPPVRLPVGRPTEKHGELPPPPPPHGVPPPPPPQQQPQPMSVQQMPTCAGYTSLSILLFLGTDLVLYPFAGQLPDRPSPHKSVHRSASPQHRR